MFTDKEVMMAAAMEMAGEIACRSPVATQGTKINLIYSRDHSVAEGLDYMVSGGGEKQQQTIWQHTNNDGVRGV